MPLEPRDEVDDKIHSDRLGTIMPKDQGPRANFIARIAARTARSLSKAFNPKVRVPREEVESSNDGES
jgi:hypothetical protein